MEYVAGRADLTAADQAKWTQALKRSFGGKAIKDGTDEGVTVSKSVVSGAIFYNVAVDVGAQAALDAYHLTYSYVPPPIAINYQMLAFQGRKPKATAKAMAFDFPRYFNEEMAPELVVWWDEMLTQGKINPPEIPEVRRVLRETRAKMRPLLLERLWHGAQLEARAGGAANDDITKQLQRLHKELSTAFKDVAPDAQQGSHYDCYTALARALGQTPQQRPLPPTPERRPSAQRNAAPLPGDPLVIVTPKGLKHLDKVVDAWVGTPYLWGGTSRRGVDCSGFSQGAYREAFSVELPRNSRAQYQVGDTVKKTELKPGDLIFFDTLDRGQVTHVGIFLGDGVFAHASSTAGVTRANLDARYYQRAYWGSRRLLR